LQASEYYRQRLEKSPNDPELHYNFGTAAYKNNMQDDAIEAFTKALKSNNVELQKKAYYNRGNSYFQKGAEAQQADPETALNQWKQAINSLESALQLDPDDADAGHNLEVIKKRLEELEEQHQQNQQTQKDDQQSEQNQEDQPQQDENGQQDSQEKQKSNDGQPEKDPGTGRGEQADDQPESPSEEKNSRASDKPEALNESEESDKNAGEQMDQDAQRQQLGKMTRAEAENLLNALKNEEGELNFVPSGADSGNNIDKDW
jgi:Ca-activated chloride channel family protein